MSSTDTTLSVPAMQVAAELGGVLDNADYESLAYVGDLDLLATIEQVVHRQAQLYAFLLAGLAEVERRDAAVAQHGVVTATWLASATNAFSFRDSRRLVEQAVALDRRFATTDTALRAGRVSPDQADAMVRTLTNLPPELSTDEVERAEVTLLGMAETYGPRELRLLTNHLVDVVAPQVGEAKLEESLRKQEADAQRDRYLFADDDHHGSLVIRGKLPILDGHELLVVIDALAKKPRTGDDEADEPCAAASWSARRADALLDIARAYSGTHELPALGGEVARVVMTTEYDAVTGALGRATLDDGTRLTAEQARLFACRAGSVLPVMFGGPGVALDVVRATRLFTGSLRRALNLRDRGCAFPGCDRPPALCDAHHIVPWWQSHRTSLDNGVLLCRYHHRLVEPDPGRPPDGQWQVSLDAVGNPRFRPPGWIDARRTARQHHRYLRSTRPPEGTSHPKRT
jgi:hypothetical protein